MKTLSLVLTAALSAFGLIACGDDTGGGTTGSGGSGGASGDGGSTSGNGGDNSSPSSSGSNNPSSTSGNNTSGNNTTGGDGGGAVGTTGPGGGGVGGGGGEFICDDGEAFPADYECDGLADCADESDEAPINPNCPVFTCDDGATVPEEFECDLLWDCGDTSDEFPANPNCEDHGVPEGWLCMPAFYGGGEKDGCDCGCGIVDPDCADATVESCEFCTEPSCAADGSREGTCDLEAIVADDNSQCI